MARKPWAAVVEALEAEEVEYVFGLPGNPELLYNDLYGSSVKPVLVRMETSAGSELSFGDGFRFGCGFMSAIVVFWIVLTILSSLVAGVAIMLAPNLSNYLPKLFGF